MVKSILEVVTFSTASGTSEHDFLAAAEEANTALRELPGFLGRKLARTEDGKWMDIVEWSDAGSAAKAAEAFHTLPAAQRFCGMIDMESATMGHHALVVSA